MHSRTAAPIAASSFCKSYRGHAASFICPYHQWTYDLSGSLASCRSAAA